MVLTCVRAPTYDAAQRGWGVPGIGFLSDKRRMNVALTRARRCLWVIGHRTTLEQDTHWRQLLAHASASLCLDLGTTKPSIYKLCPRPCCPC